MRTPLGYNAWFVALGPSHICHFNPRPQSHLCHNNKTQQYKISSMCIQKPFYLALLREQPTFFACCMHVTIELTIFMSSDGGESHRFYPGYPTPTPSSNRPKN